VSAVSRPPTDVGSEFTIGDLGTEDGGKAISALRDAFDDCFGELALVLDREDGRSVYSFDGSSPIYCCHVPDDTYDREQHGPQTVGFRYNYRFMNELEESTIRIVDWEETRFTDVEEVVYP